MLCGCQPPDPRLVGMTESLAAWEEGVSLLDEAPGEARLAFAAARGQRPDPLLYAWEAHAAAAAGDMDGAIQLSEEALGLSVLSPVVRYNLAAYLARQGAIDEAGPHLQRALEQDARTPAEVRMDDDFRVWLDHPALGFLPVPQLILEVTAPRTAVFLGSECTVSIRLLGDAGEGELRVGAADALEGALRLSRVREERVAEATEIAWTFRVVGAGQAKLGPLRLEVAGQTMQTEAVRFDTLAPPDRVVDQTLKWLDVRSPTELVGERVAPAAWLEAGEVWVLAPPAARVQLLPKPETPMARYEYHREGAAQWVLYRAQTSGGSVSIRVGRKDVLSVEL